MRKTIIVLSCCTVLLLLGYTGYRGYRVWREKHLMSMAKEFAAKSDGHNTLLSLQQILHFNSRNVEACRMMAGLTEASHSPNALVWRDRVVELNPKSLDDRLALVKTALAFGNLGIATNALAAVDVAGRETADYHNLAGTVAFATGQRESAESHFSEAARLEPWNSIPILYLSAVRLTGTNTLDQAEARIALKRVSQTSTNLDQRCIALRELTADALRSREVDSALTLSEELLRQTNAVFPDRLLRLKVLRETKQAAFKPALASVQREAGTDPGKISDLAMWQLANLGPGDALAWLNTLPKSTQTNQVLAMLSARCRIGLKDWHGLQSTLEKQNWGEMEFMRHAFVAQALRNLDLTAAAKAEWGQALESAGNQKARITMLLQFAAGASWSSESEELLWKIVNQFPEDQQAVQVLTMVLYKSGRTRPLLNLFALQARRKPADLSLKNNLAMTALLLDVQELKPFDIAHDIYQKAPTNTAFASTYAYSLHLQGKDAEALKIFQTLKPQELQNPTIAGYYGLILKATGSSEKAQAYLNWAFKGPMLPEERKMFELAKAGK